MENWTVFQEISLGTWVTAGAAIWTAIAATIVAIRIGKLASGMPGHAPGVASPRQAPASPVQPQGAAEKPSTIARQRWQRHFQKCARCTVGHPVCDEGHELSEASTAERAASRGARG